MSQNHHQAVDNLINVFGRASHDLTVVHSKLDKEFQQIYPDNVSNSIPFFTIWNPEFSNSTKETLRIQTRCNFMGVLGFGFWVVG